ncbi:MAG: DUF805 domain-containing protein [Leuconostoc carnosum]|uniref:DUF805 domain-containing protein n=1 Tax=Leuconostoc carnosum TaxID=1252 RepID=UPI003F97182B
MSAWESLVDFFKKYHTFRGSSSRSAYNWMAWFWGLIYISLAIVIVLIAGLGTFFGQHGHFQNNSSSFLETVVVVLVISVCMSVVVILPNLALKTRRLHDMGYSGWWQLLPIIIACIAAGILLTLGLDIVPYESFLMVPNLLFTLWLTFTKTNKRSKYQ